MRGSVVLTGLMITIACSNPVAPALADVSAQVTRLPGVSDKGIAIAVRVENTQRDSVYFNFCASSLERETSRSWEWAGGVFCNAIGYPHPLGGMIPISPGESVEVTLHFYGVADFAQSHLGQPHRVRVQVVAPPPDSWWSIVGSRVFQAVLTDPFIPVPDLAASR
jgi:hypothetical protein